MYVCMYVHEGWGWGWGWGWGVLGEAHGNFKNIELFLSDMDAW